MAKIKKCPNCGGHVEFIQEKNIYKCLHCGSSFAGEEEQETKQVEEPTQNQESAQPQGEQSAVQEESAQTVDFERQSYSNLSYKEVQKARLHGKMFKVDVPKLDHMLHKTEKTRVSYVIFASVMFALAAATFGLMLFMALIMLPPLFGVTLPNPEWDVFGLASSLVGMGILLGVIAALTVLVIFGVIGGYLVYNGIKSLQLSTATKEEMAHGPTITRFILSSIIVVVAIIIIMIALLFIMNDRAKLFETALPWIMIGVVVGFIVVFVKLVYDKVQAVKWFKTLPPEEQANYKEHVNAIKNVRHKRERMHERNRRLFWR